MQTIQTMIPIIADVIEFPILCQSSPNVLGLIKVSFNPNKYFGQNPAALGSGLITICPDIVNEQSFKIMKIANPFVDFTNCP